MTPFIEEAQRLLAIAERDAQAFRILRVHADAPLAPTCFHAQQCVEKALKAVLTGKQIAYRRTHDLEELANLLAEAGLVIPLPIDCYRRLNPYAVEVRYDDQVIALLTFDDAEDIMDRTLSWVHTTLSDLAA